MPDLLAVLVLLRVADPLAPAVLLTLPDAETDGVALTLLEIEEVVVGELVRLTELVGVPVRVADSGGVTLRVWVLLPVKEMDTVAKAVGEGVPLVVGVPLFVVDAVGEGEGDTMYCGALLAKVTATSDADSTPSCRRRDPMARSPPIRPVPASSHAPTMRDAAGTMLSARPVTTLLAAPFTYTVSVCAPAPEPL